MKKILLATVLASTALSAFAAYQVRYIFVHLAPYYEAAESREANPRIATASGFDKQFLSRQPEPMRQVDAAVRAEPASVTPITMMVLAIRSYDVGLRDQAVFWYHAARNRMATAAAVLDLGQAETANLERTMRAFSLKVGPVINGYGLCDVERYKKQRREALEWSEKNPWAHIFVETVPARAGDRKALYAASLKELRTEVEDEAARIGTPAEVAKRTAARREAEAEVKYCW